MMVFLEVNGIKVECSDKDIIDLGLGVGSGKYSNNI